MTVYGWAAMLLTLFCAAVAHGEPPRRCLALLLYPVGPLGWPYLLFQLLLQASAVWKLCRGTVYGWAVTPRLGGTGEADPPPARAADASKAPAAARAKREYEMVPADQGTAAYPPGQNDLHPHGEELRETVGAAHANGKGTTQWH